ncbi:10357_t:CDS:2, partial [Entrophospora sp. SA101]
ANAREQVYLSTEPINYPNNDYQHREKLAKVEIYIGSVDNNFDNPYQEWVFEPVKNIK